MGMSLHDPAFQPRLIAFMWDVFHEYASLFEVTLVRSSERKGRRTGTSPGPWSWHGILIREGIAYNKQRREVHCLEHLEGVEEEYAQFMPHEVTHVVWPGRKPSSADHEWDIGMISFELAWLDRLCGPSPLGRDVYALYREYADDGMPGPIACEKATAKAKKTVKKHGLPDPWAAQSLIETPAREVG